MERDLRVNLLGPGPHLIKKNLPGHGLTKFEKHWSRRPLALTSKALRIATIPGAVALCYKIHEHEGTNHIRWIEFW